MSVSDWNIEVAQVVMVCLIFYYIFLVAKKIIFSHFNFDLKK